MENVSRPEDGLLFQLMHSCSLIAFTPVIFISLFIYIPLMWAFIVWFLIIIFTHIKMMDYIPSDY